MVKQRQGGTTGDNSWYSQGTSNTDTSAKDVFIQVGSVVSTSGANKIITFATAYNQTPIVVASTTSASTTNAWPVITDITTTTFTFRMQNDAGSSSNTEIACWIAIGQ